MKFGPYQLKRKLGAGGMGEVFLASEEMQHGVRRRVVLKRILPHLSDDPAFAEGFTQEARILAQLNHPNIAALVDFGDIDGQLYLAIEFVDGVDLLQVIEAGEKIPIGVALRVVLDVAMGLGHAHTATDEDGKPLEIVHRDVTPSNMLLAMTGRAKVVDFGIAKDNQGTGKRTTTGVIKGKYGYLAPEQVNMAPADQRVDVFALGIVAYELVCGVHPFRRGNEFQTMSAIADETPVAPSELGAPARLSAVIMRALEKDPARRFASMQELAAAVHQAATADHVAVAVESEVAAWLTALRERLPERTERARNTTPLETATRPSRQGEGTGTSRQGRQDRQGLGEELEGEELEGKAPGGTGSGRSRGRARAFVYAVAAAGVIAAGALYMSWTWPPPAPIATAVTAPASAPASAPEPASQPIAQPTPKPEQPKSVVSKNGTLSIQLKDFGGAVFVDSDFIEEGPPWNRIANITLTPGNHTVRVKYDAQHIDATFPVTIKAGKKSALSISKEQALAH